MLSLTKLNPTAPQTIPTCKVGEAWLYHALAKVAGAYEKKKWLQVFQKNHLDLEVDLFFLRDLCFKSNLKES